MSYRSAICEAENTGDGPCSVCGAERGDSPPRSRRLMIMIGLIITVTGLITFVEHYPPGSTVRRLRSYGTYKSMVATVWMSVLTFCIGIAVAAVGLYLDNRKRKGK